MGGQHTCVGARVAKLISGAFVTGGIACGKSLVAANLGNIFVIDCDELARKCTKKGSWGWRRVKSAFRDHEFFEPDGSINRSKLGEVVYADPRLRKRLNKATHLPIQLQIGLRIFLCWILCTPTAVRCFVNENHGWVQKLSWLLHLCPCSGNEFTQPLLHDTWHMVVDMPLLFETKSEWLFSDIIVVTCTPEQQLERLCSRDNLSQEAASSRIRAQFDMSYKAAHGTLIIDNSGSIQDTLVQVHDTVGQLKRKECFWTSVLARAAILGGAITAVWLICYY